MQHLGFEESRTKNSDGWIVARHRHQLYGRACHKEHKDHKSGYLWTCLARERHCLGPFEGVPIGRTGTPTTIDYEDDPTSAQRDPKGLIFVLSVLFVAILRTRTRTASKISAALVDHADRR
jgi:hypothetical protein